jgi:NAD(P)H-nitrite reductase large subunit
MQADPYPVKQCVCFEKTFTELKASGAKSLDEIIQRFNCSTGCGLCRPYIQKMLQTGETEFAVIPED